MQSPLQAVPAVLFTAFIIYQFVCFDTTLAQQKTVSNATVQEIKLLSFNAWNESMNVNNGEHKVLNAILASGADVVGLSEAEEEFGNTIAEKLHWFKTINSDNSLLSRFPIKKTWKSITGAGAEIIIDNNKKIAVHTVHLTYTPYGPYTACLDEADYTKIYDDEESSGRVAEITHALTAIHAYVQDGTPTFLLGDLNSPSHLDWIEATAEQHCWYAVEWPVTVKVEEDGLFDSYRQLHPDPASDPGITWSPIYEEWLYGSGKPEPMDRIDFIFFTDVGVQVLNSDVFTVGALEQYPRHLQNQWPSDHCAVLATFAVETGAPVVNQPVAKFYASTPAIAEGGTVQFTDISTNAPTAWSWTFAGGTPDQSTLQNPLVTYNSAGDFAVTLIAANADGSDTTKVNKLIKVEKITLPPQLVLNKKVYSLDPVISPVLSGLPCGCMSTVPRRQERA
jgi:hypothetical protein